MKTRPTIYVNLHCEEGRGMLQLGLDTLTAAEREFLVRVFDGADKGVSFDVAATDDGRQCMTFTIGRAEAAAPALVQ